MFYSIYKLNEEIKLEEIERKMSNFPVNTSSSFDNLSFKLFLNNENFKINNKFPDDKFTHLDEFEGDILIENTNSTIPFKIRLKSGFIFMETDFPIKKVSAVKILNYILNKHLIRFIPFYEDEFNFICNIADNYDSKFFFDGDIVHDEKLEKQYCKKELKEDYSLFEAYLELKHDDSKIPLYYYGDAIQFPPRVSKEDIEYAIQTFENVMTGNYCHDNKGRD